MNRAFGFGLVAVGILLLIWGLQASDSLGSELSRFFTGSPTDRTVWLLIGGLLATVMGGIMAFGGRARG